MKKALLISYNLLKENEEPIPLSIASILATLKSDPAYGIDFSVDHLPINMVNNTIRIAKFDNYLNKLELYKYNYIGISCFVWNEYLINPLIDYLRNAGYQNKIILGGSQITYSGKERLKIDYPKADLFISGFAEESLFNILKNGDNKQNYFSSKPEFSTLPSPYVCNTIPIKNKQEMLRWETKRGCPFHCSFCAHRDLENGRVYHMSIEKAYAELAIFKQNNVKRINVLDPIFNIGTNYIDILKEIKRLNFQETVFTLQSKIELLEKESGSHFLDLVQIVNAHLEFGLQTIIEDEYKVINRTNNLVKITRQLALLKERSISYEVSLIYGLPNQTFDSFRKSLDFLQDNGCSKITAWPLMLLKGTPLIEKKDSWDLKEEVLGEYNIPIVTSSSTFSKEEWLAMKELAANITNNRRFI